MDPPCCPCRECGCGLDPCNDDCDQCTCATCTAKANLIQNDPFGPIISEYRVAIGDALEISVFGDKDTLVDNVTVAPDGHIYYFFLNGIKAAGLTLSELRVELEKNLEEYFLSPMVTIIPRAMTSQTYTILGLVNSPGLYPLQQSVSLRQAVGAAGGIFTGDEFFAGIPTNPRGGVGNQRPLVGYGGSGHYVDLKKSYIARDGIKMNIDFERLMYSADNSQDIQVKPGDYIYIAPMDSRDIYVLGAAINPTILSYYDGMTLMGAVASVGGWIEGPYGADMRRLLVIRGSLRCPKVMYVDVCCILNGCATDTYLEPGDIVYFTEKRFSFGRELVRLAVESFISAFFNTAGNFYADEILD